MSIYTKFGDRGKTTLIGGEKVNKDCLILETVGNIDELNASLGLVVSELSNFERFLQLTKFIQTTQNHLFRVGAELVALRTDLAEKGDIKLIGVLHIKILEKIIDRIDHKMPPLKQFVLPGGCRAGAYLHLARTICRRLERSIVSLGKEKDVRSELYMFINRLGDFLFIMARWVNFNMEHPEIIVKFKNK